MNEDSLKLKLESLLNKDFVLRKEVGGNHLIHNSPVRIDYLVKAKPHLVAAGFTPEWFGVECKWIEGIEGQTSKVSKLFWQGITYQQSRFLVDGETIMPSFVAVLVNDKLHPNIENHFKALAQLALYGHVGEMFFYRDGNWGIRFTWLYARSFGNEYSINQAKLPKVRVGSI